MKTLGFVGELLLCGAVILLSLACQNLREQNEGLRAEVSVLSYSLGECETGGAVYRGALREAVSPSDNKKWTRVYEEWESSRFKTKEVQE